MKCLIFIMTFLSKISNQFQFMLIKESMIRNGNAEWQVALLALKQPHVILESSQLHQLVHFFHIEISIHYY